MPSAVFLCDVSGVMARPWADVGYRCLCIDIQHSIRGDRVDGNTTYRWADVRSLVREDLPDDIAFAAAFPPSTHGAVCGARDWRRKGLQGCIDWLTTIESCRRILSCLDCPWMLEQPVVDRVLASRWREPDYTFNPCDFGGYPGGEQDAYTKKTNLWTGGGFVMPEPRRIEPSDGSRMWLMTPGKERANLRSQTPAGFARAVFEANAPVNA